MNEKKKKRSKWDGHPATIGFSYLKGKIMVCLTLMNDPAETEELLTQETEETIAVAVPWVRAQLARNKESKSRVKGTGDMQREDCAEVLFWLSPLTLCCKSHWWRNMNRRASAGSWNGKKMWKSCLGKWKTLQIQMNL